MDYLFPTPQEIEQMLSRAFLADEDHTAQIPELIQALILNRIEQHLARLANDLSESPDLSRLADTLDAIRRHGLVVEDVYGGGKK